MTVCLHMNESFQGLHFAISNLSLCLRSKLFMLAITVLQLGRPRQHTDKVLIQTFNFTSQFNNGKQEEIFDVVEVLIILVCKLSHLC